MEHFRIYDRQTLAVVDGGIVRDYNVDFDFLANNSSTLTLTEETYAKKGDILAIIKGTDKLCMCSLRECGKAHSKSGQNLSGFLKRNKTSPA